MKKVKVTLNDNLICLFNFINSYSGKLTFAELLQYAIDYECYKELYLHLTIIENLRLEHNQGLMDPINL